jgi:hypothetical protein
VLAAVMKEAPVRRMVDKFHLLLRQIIFVIHEAQALLQGTALSRYQA